jgi:thiol-disulfide isomerase/thioredoxin
MHTKSLVKFVPTFLVMRLRPSVLNSMLLAVLFCLPLWVQADGAVVGQEAPAVRLPVLSSGEDVSLDSLRGKVVYLDFWASWCGPCRVSFPILEALASELGPSGFEVLAINVDEVEADAQEFLSEVPVNYLVVRDAKGVSPQAYGILGMPTGYLIDREGVVREIHQGFRKSDGDQLRTEIVKLLGE